MLRQQIAWLLRMEGWSLQEIGNVLEVSRERARQLAEIADTRMEKVCDAKLSHGPITDQIAYNIWYTFDHEGRIGLRRKTRKPKHAE